MINLLTAFDFELKRQAGSHMIFANQKIPELINLQNKDGEAKPYQIQQFLNLVNTYNLKLKKE